MKAAVLIARLIFGGWFVFAGLNFFFRFVPQPYGNTEVAITFTTSLIDTHLFHVVKAIEFVCGVLILANRLTALSLAAIFPIAFTVGFFNAHLMGGPVGWGIAAVVVGFNLFLVWAYRQHFIPLFALAPQIAGGSQSGVLRTVATPT